MRSRLKITAFFFKFLAVSFCVFLGVETSNVVLVPTLNAAEPESKPFVDKTLVVWAAPTVLEQRGGSALTIDLANPDAFDAVVFAELTPNVWAPGSTGFYRVEQNQSNWPKETQVGEFVRIAIVYRGKEISFYRGSNAPIVYTASGELQAFDESATLLFGPRHEADQNDVFIGKIRDARIYPFALSAEQVAALEPGEPLDGAVPWVWFDFSTGLYDKANRFKNFQFDGDAKIEDGALVLGFDKGSLRAKTTAFNSEPNAVDGMKRPFSDVDVETVRAFREKLLADPTRPRSRFAIPEGIGVPGDPNGCFWANGRYHLMYLYNRKGNKNDANFSNAGDNFCWGHLTSVDLVHWQNLPDAIGPGDGDAGCFSGGAFLDDDGSAYLTYWALGGGGIGLAKSTGPDSDYSVWAKLPDNPIIAETESGLAKLETPNGTTIYGVADPSNIWKKDGKYYLLTGNLLVLNQFGRAADSPDEMKGDRAYLFESSNLKKWEYKGVFYERRDDWTDVSEDNMCPSFLPLPRSKDGGPESGKHLLLFISHNKGCQYYIGTYDKENDRFLPEKHGRMTWVDNTYFAPEALIDGRGRQIAWSWLLDNPNDGRVEGWTGVYGLPRTLWLGDDGSLRMAPVPELEALRINPVSDENFVVEPGQLKKIDGFPGDSCELEIVVSAKERAKTRKIGATVRIDEKNGEETRIYFDVDEKKLVFDATKSGPGGRPTLESAPLELPENEDLTLRIFVDRSAIEVYANDRQAIARRVFPTNPTEARGTALWLEADRPTTVLRFNAWETAAANPF